MERLKPQELQAAKRIYNRVNDLADNYYGKKTENGVRSFLSANRWIMFPVNNVESLREGASHPVPNVFISFDGYISDNHQGQVNGWLGLTYNNTDAMRWLHDSIRPKNQEWYINTVRNLPDGWNVEIQHKIKTNYQDNAPIFRTVRSLPAQSLNAGELGAALKDSDSRLPRRSHDFEDEPVLSAITMVSISKITSTSNFDDDARTAFNLFFEVLNRRAG